MSDWQNRYQRLLFDRPHPKVLRVTMNRPEKYNATDAIMHRELVDVWRDINGDDTVNCVIIQGAGGKVFSAGGANTLIALQQNTGTVVWKTTLATRGVTCRFSCPIAIRAESSSRWSLGSSFPSRYRPETATSPRGRSISTGRPNPKRAISSRCPSE